MTRLVFHLGDKKTGSTAIQTALASRGWTCDSVKLVYPHGNRVSHITLARSLSGKLDASRTERLAQEIRTELATHADADVAVISAEDFEDVDPKVLKKALELHFPDMLADASFIAYVRPHADRFASSYAERVKAGTFVGTLEEMQALLHQRKTIVYAPRFLAWRAVFGAAFDLRPMIRDQLFRQDVVADFLRFALRTDDFILAETPDSNESLSLENLSIVRQFQLRLNGGKNNGEAYQATIGRALARRMNDSAFRSGTHVRIHKSLAEKVRDQYAGDAAALDAAFFRGTPMTDALNAAPAKAVDVAQSVRIEDHFTDREQYLINIFVDQTAVLVKADPDYLAAALRLEHRTSVIVDEDGEGAVPAKRRRAGGGPGGKMGRKSGARGAGRAATAAEGEQPARTGGPGKRAGRPGGAKAAGAKAAGAKVAGVRANVANPGAAKPGGIRARLAAGGKAGPRAGRAKAKQPTETTED